MTLQPLCTNQFLANNRSDRKSKAGATNEKTKSVKENNGLRSGQVRVINYGRIDVQIDRLNVYELYIKNPIKKTRK